MSAAQRVTVITGAGRGIGAALARRFAALGHRLELTNLDAAELEVVRGELPAQTVAGSAAFDLRDRRACESWIRGIRERHARLDVLLLNAGVGGPDPEDDVEALFHLRQVLEVNATAVMRAMRGLGDLLPGDGSGRIVVTASILGRMGVAGFSAYCASKAAVIGLVRAAALEFARKRITVNAICPGWTDTAMAQQGFEAIARAGAGDPVAARREVEAGLPLGRIVRPEEVAGLAAFLAGPDAGAMTGQALLMDGGDLQK